MVLENFQFTDEKKKKRTMKVKVCKSVWSKFSGLMFRKNSPPLLFVFKKEKKLSIHSLFCKPFEAYWLDDKMKTCKKMTIVSPGFNFSAKGKYLLEVPLAFSRGKIETFKYKTSLLKSSLQEVKGGIIKWEK